MKRGRKEIKDRRKEGQKERVLQWRQRGKGKERRNEDGIENNRNKETE